MESTFKLPIYYLNNKYIVSNVIKEDIDLLPTKSSSNNDTPLENSELDISNSQYTLKHLFNPQNDNEEELIHQWASYYTNNRKFLKDSQTLYKQCKLDLIPEFYEENNQNENKILFNRLKELKSNDEFYAQYNYIDWKYCSWLNNYAWFLQLLSLYTLASPILTLCAPIFMLLVPFFLLKFNGINLSFSGYFKSLFQLLKQNVFAKLIINFNSVPWDKRIYMIFSVFMYVFQIYSNVQFCFRFYKNMSFIGSTNKLLVNFISRNESHVNTYSDLVEKLDTYHPFHKILTRHIGDLVHYKENITYLNNFKLSFHNFFSMGSLLKHYYALFHNDTLIESLYYMLDFQSYLGNIFQINSNLQNKHLNTIILKPKLASGYLHLKDVYTPIVGNRNVVKNTVKLDKQMLITGPNASGKTTLLKATLLNVLLAQQIGCGYFAKESKIRLYDEINCYINIPDNSGRDSLFQSEARRCKEIYDSVMNNLHKHHFCIFDELYSGTNPYEAISASYSFINHLSKQSNIDFMLTTHYIDLCKHLDNNSKLQNCCMKTIAQRDDFKYTYKLESSISNIRGGVKVLQDLGYPRAIVDDTRKFLEKIELLSIKKK